jgi:tetratricopeptide (TPR) repeat protein
VPEAAQSHFFISYTSADRVWAEWIAWQLEEAGYQVKIQAWDFSPGGNFVVEMQKATVECERTIAVFSPNYFLSEFGAAEWAAAFRLDPTGKNEKLIPVRIEDCQPPGLLGSLIYIDLVKLDETTAHERLLADLPRGRRKPSTGPQFPGASDARLTASAAKPEFPGALPQYWNLPGRNRLFTGREDVIEKLHEVLERDRRAVLSGLGGIGKTQTAIEYAHRYHNDYNAVFFIRADTEAALTAGMVEIASLLTLPERGAKDQKETVAAANRWLLEHDRWLLIADNAYELALVKNVLPFDAPGQILLTTRAAGTGAVAEAVKVKKMEPEEGAHFLLRRAGLLGRASGHQPAPGDQQTAARELSIKLDGLPLALDQAGAFIEETPSSPIEYLQLYAEAGAELRRIGRPEHDSVHATFSLAFEKVEGASRAAADLLRLCAFFAPDQIPEEMFIKGAPELGENLGLLATNALQRTQIIGQACRFSLLQRDAISKNLSIHRQVQAVLRDMMAEKGEEGMWAERAVRAVGRTFPSPEFSTWPLCDRLLAHALACADLVNHWGFEFYEAARLLSDTGFYLYERNRYIDVEPLYQRALAISEKALGPEHSNVASSLNNLAAFYATQGRYAEAEPLFQRALAILGNVLGSEHHSVATSLNNLAELSQSQGQYVKAELLYQNALAIREKALSSEHPDVALSLNTLATLYHTLGQYAKAEPLYQRALAIREKTLGPEHPDVANSLNNLGALYKTQGQYAKAESLYRRALAISEKALGPEHSNVASSLNNLAELYYYQGEYAKAQPFYERALAIREKVLGSEHPEVATSLNNLAVLYDNQGQYAKGEPLYQCALAIREKTLGPEHPDVANSLNNLAELYKTQGQYAKAESLYQRALTIWETALGPEHPEVATSLNNIAELYRVQGQYEKAEPLFHRALTIREKVLGPEHPDVATSLNNLAALYDNQCQYEKAEPLFHCALTIRKEVLGPEHPDMAYSLNNLGLLYYKQGQLTKAEPLFQRSLTIFENILGPEHRNVATCLENYASLLRKMGRPEEAEPLEVRARAIRTKIA